MCACLTSCWAALLTFSMSSTAVVPLRESWFPAKCAISPLPLVRAVNQLNTMTAVRAFTFRFRQCFRFLLHPLYLDLACSVVWQISIQRFSVRSFSCNNRVCRASLQCPHMIHSRRISSHKMLVRLQVFTSLLSAAMKVVFISPSACTWEYKLCLT